LLVMAGLVPAIHVLATRKKDVDARHKAGHDENRDSVSDSARTRTREACDSQRMSEPEQPG
jgi:hypothetical protein